MSKSEIRRATKIISVRVTPEQGELLRRATVAAIRAVPGASMGVSSFLLAAGLARAEELLNTPSPANVDPPSRRRPRR